MIPVTYPSSVSTSKESQMVVFALTNVTGLRRWTDYIPVKLQSTGADIANSFNTNGYLACDFLQTTTGRQAWIDYIPVFVDNAATVPWQVSDTGFIPFNTLAGGGIYYSGPTLDLNFVGSLSNPLFSSAGQDYSLNTNFLSLFYQVEAQYSVLGTNGVEQKNFADIVTFTRASTATYFNSAGTLTTAAINEARFDHNPSTLAPLGFLIEEQRTNSIRNNTMQGAVAGTPGTVPTNWGVIGGGLGTLTQQIVGTGTSAGITYIDIRLSGTTSTTGLGYTFESVVNIAASVGQTWTGSFYVARVAGANTNITAIETRVVDRDAGGANIGVSVNNFLSSLATSFTRPTVTRTLAGVGTAFVSSDIFISFASGVAIDITLRIGLPQLELGAFATSVIPTTTTALTRSADVASVNTLSPWYNASEGTVYANYRSFATTAFPDVVTVSDGTNANRQQQFIDASNGFTTFREVVSSTQQGIASQNSTMNTEVRSAGAYSSAGVVFTVNGVAPVTNANTTHPTGLNKLNLGASGTGLGNFLNGYIRRITYYPRRLPNADLQTITA